VHAAPLNPNSALIARSIPFKDRNIALRALEGFEDDMEKGAVVAVDNDEGEDEEDYKKRAVADEDEDKDEDEDEETSRSNTAVLEGRRMARDGCFLGVNKGIAV